MYIRFVVDPPISHKVNKVIRRVVRDLRNIFQEVTFSVEIDETLTCSVDNSNRVSALKILRRKFNLNCYGFVVYIVNSNLVWCKKDIWGLSYSNRCIVGLRRIEKTSFKIWESKVWDLILHELGHSFGLIQKYRSAIINPSYKTKHCPNNCVMSEKCYDYFSNKTANDRFVYGKPYCSLCLKYLSSKDA